MSYDNYIYDSYGGYTRGVSYYYDDSTTYSSDTSNEYDVWITIENDPYSFEPKYVMKKRIKIDSHLLEDELFEI